MILKRCMMTCERKGTCGFFSIKSLCNDDSMKYLHAPVTSLTYNFRLDEFMAGFNAISLKLKEMYQVCN